MLPDSAGLSHLETLCHWPGRPPSVRCCLIHSTRVPSPSQDMSEGYLFHDVPSALRLHARAIELNPNLPIAWTVSSWSRIYNGEHGTAVRHAMMSQSLSPRDPHVWFAQHAMMTAQLFNRNLEEAAILSERCAGTASGHVSALNSPPRGPGPSGAQGGSSQCLAQLRNFDPKVTVDKIASRIPLKPGGPGLLYRRPGACGCTALVT